MAKMAFALAEEMASKANRTGGNVGMIRMVGWVGLIVD